MSEKKPRKKWLHKPAPISDEAYAEMEKRFGVPRAELEKTASELRLGRPKLETHLIVLAAEAKRKNRE
jgi:hypothetical protein